jgi:CRISPR-associated protein Cas5t
VKHLQAVRLSVHGNFNSFRIGSAIKYHRTYYVPTKTTLIGLLGSALGLEDNKLQNMFTSMHTNAILDSYSGHATDLWLITKLKTQGRSESSPIMREILFEPHYSIYYLIYQSINELDIDDIINAFEDPVFALSLGRSDEMIEVKEVIGVNLSSTSSNSNEYYFKHTILPFNYKDFFANYERLSPRIGQTFSVPQVISIPVSFKIEGENIRRPFEYLDVTMVYDLGVRISNREDCWSDGERKFFLY